MCYIFWVCSCSHSCPAWNAHVPYYHLLAVPLYAIFPHYLINSTILKKIIEYKTLVLNFCATFVWNISESRKSWVRYNCDGTKCNYDCTKYNYNCTNYNYNCTKYNCDCTQFLTYSSHYYCQVLMKLDFSWQIFKKFTHITLYENLSSGSRVFPWGQTDITNTRAAFWNFTNLPKIPHRIPLFPTLSNCMWQNKISTKFLTLPKYLI
jgi:hypothetical protein